MKKFFALWVLVNIAVACSVCMKSRPVVYKVTVTDKKNNSFIDSAKVILTSVTDSRDINEYVKYTDSHGRCSFSLDVNSSAQYRVGSMKKGYVGYYDKSYPDLDRSYLFLTEKTGNTITLYLTSDTLNHRNYWVSHTTRYDIDTLVNLLKSNNYPLRSEFPLLLWEDIPELLAIGDSRILINKYPMNVASSSYQEDCYLGIVALWFIESIRISELRKTVNPFEKFPSLTPSLRYTGSDKQEPTANRTEILEKAYRVYVKWWDKVKNLDKEDACNINPFKNTNMEW
jgi:hypothetical protein